MKFNVIRHSDNILHVHFDACVLDCSLNLHKTPGNIKCESQKCSVCAIVHACVCARMHVMFLSDVYDVIYRPSFALQL